MNRGFLAATPNELRSFPMAMLRDWSKSPKTFVGPDSLAQFLPGYDFPWVLPQDLHHFHRLLLDSDFQPDFRTSSDWNENRTTEVGRERVHLAFWAGSEV